MSIYDSRSRELGFLSTIIHLGKKRRLIVELARIELYQKYKASALGILWSFLNPLLITSVIYFVFGKLLNSYMPENRGYAVWVYSGILLQVLLIQGLTVAASSIQRNLNIITKNRISPIVMGFSASLAHSVNFALGALLLLPLSLITNQQVSIRVFLLPIFLILSACALTGFGIAVTGLFMKYDDTVYIFNAATMILTYLTPIFYPISLLEGNLKILVSLNPLTSWISTLRWLFLDQYLISPWNIIVVFLSSIFLLLFGITVLKNRWKIWQML